MNGDWGVRRGSLQRPTISAVFNGKFNLGNNDSSPEYGRVRSEPLRQSILLSYARVDVSFFRPLKTVVGDIVFPLLRKFSYVINVSASTEYGGVTTLGRSSFFSAWPLIFLFIFYKWALTNSRKSELSPY